MGTEIFTDMNAVHADIAETFEATGAVTADEYSGTEVDKECYEYDPRSHPGRRIHLYRQ